ncbi:RE1 [Symbiodinium sp. CCMP2592]|nr:RE1 [Symbiodinium sp. CCMP2592]
MDPALRRRRQERQEQEPASPSAPEDGAPEVNPFWSEKAKMEISIQKARPLDLVRCDDEVLEPDYNASGKGRGLSSSQGSSEVIKAAGGQATDPGVKGRFFQEQVEEIQNLRMNTTTSSTWPEQTVLGNSVPQTHNEQPDWLTMSPLKSQQHEASLESGEQPELATERRFVPTAVRGDAPGLETARDSSDSGVSVPKVAGVSRTALQAFGDSSASLEIPETSTTFGTVASDGGVPNRSNYVGEVDRSSLRVVLEGAESVSEGTARRSIPLSPEAQKSQKSSAYEIPDPSEQHFEIVRLRSLVEHLHDRLEKAEAERSTRGSRSFGSASSGHRVEELELKGQRVNFQSEEGYPLPPVPPLPPFASEGWSSWNASDPLHSTHDLVLGQEPPRQSSLDMDFGPSVHSPMAFPGDKVPLTSTASAPGATLSPSEVPSMDFGLHSFTGPPGVQSSSGIPNPVSPSEVPSMDFGLHSAAGAGPQYFALSPRAQLPTSSGVIRVMGVNHSWKVVNGSLVLEPMDFVPPPPPQWTSPLVAAPPTPGAWSNSPSPPKHPAFGAQLPVPSCHAVSSCAGAAMPRYQSPPPRPPSSTPPPSPPAPSGLSLPIAAPPVGNSGRVDVKDLRPEAVGKHVSSLPSLEAYNPNNPTALGDWIAVVQPMISSLSDTGSVWWGYTYQAANQAYVRWLSTSPLERLSIQKEFDQVNLVQPQHALLEQRCVTLILQAILDAVRVDIVASRHLSVAGMIFRLMTVFQPGGASERSTMLRFLVTPKAASTLSEAAKLLRQWTQWRMRLKQLHAAEPDTTLLVKGLDVLTGKVLQKHSASLFRLATFRERLGVDYQPTSDAVSELCRMMQAEVEHLMHSTDDNPVKDEVQGRGDDAKKQRLQRLQTSPSTPKAKASPAGPKSPGAGMKPCRSWLTAGGCTYGSSCQFYHDQDEEKMRGRCFCCSAEDHWADSCPAEAAAPSQGDGNAAINAEILSVLRSIKTKALRLSAVSNPTGYGLLDSGASASLRQASPQEIQESRPVSLSLAIGEALMHVNSAGTLLVRESVQPILPMHALPLLGCEINWTDRGIHVRHPGLGILPVRLKDGTPELPEFLVLRLIGEYERFLLRRETSRAVSQQLWQRSVGQEEVGLSSLREWVAAHVAADSCSESELQLIVKTLFPGLPERLASQVAVSPTFDPSCVPFNRRTRRQLFDPQFPTLVHLFAGKQRWRHSVGQVLEVDISRGSDLLSDDVFGMLLRAATLGVIDGVVCGPPSRTFNPEALASSSNGLKFRGEEGDDRFGFSDLSPSDRALVDRDTLLFLRSLLLTFVASCAKEKFFNCLEMPETSTAWEWPEYENVSVCLGGWTASFDQGLGGHPCSKATAVYTSSFQLYESLHELKLPPEVIEAPASNFYGKEWAPGLVSRVLRAWDDYCCVSFERLQAHTVSGKDSFSTCARKPLWLRCHPRFGKGTAKQIICRVAMIAQFAFKELPAIAPTSRSIRICLSSPVMLRVRTTRAVTLEVDEAKAQDKEDPHASLIYQPVYTKLGDDFLEEPSSAVGVSSTPGEDDDSALPVSFEVKSPHKPPPLQPEGSDSDDGQEFVTLVWAEPLKTRQSFNVQLAIMRAVARLRAFGIPCFRFHSDRAREYLSDSLERFLAEQGIHSTRTAPEDHPSNGAAEVAIREVKRAARRALLSANLPSCHWPTAVRHAGEVMWRKGLVRLGGAARSLLAYGTPVEARKRLRHRDVWMSRTRSGVLIGPAPQTLSSYLVLFEDDTVCITSAVYPVDYRPRPPSDSLKAGSDGPVDFLSDSADQSQITGMPEVPQQEFSTLQGQSSPWSERSALLEKIKATWECSAFTHTEDGPVEYCGLEISESADGLLIGQTKYIKELLKRHNVQGSAKSPCAAWSANFDDGESRDDPVDPEAVKAAQSITGELLWLSVRARPELSFPVSRMAQLTTKRPKDALSIGQGVLRFLNSSPQCIVYGPPPGDCGASQQYPRPVVETTLHAFADASFGPSSGRSHQGLLVCWAGAPLHWESGRQTLTALSTAESELISYVCVVQAAEAVEALIGEIFPEPLTRSLFGDNSSAISIVSGPPTSWRSRHLRLRSHALRERIENGVWTVYHLSGLLMPADILTKAMTASKFGDMLPFLGVKNPSEDCRLRLAAVLACCALLLKGQGSPEPEGWGWVIVYLTVVILAYEGFRSFLRRFLGLVAYVFPGLGARFPGVLDVHSSPDSGTTQQPAASTPPSSFTQLPAPGARLPRGSSSSIGARLPSLAPSSSGCPSNLRSIGVNTNPEDYAPLPPVLPAAPAAAYRHPIDLVSHSTSSGSHWHQNPECYHLRNRDHSSLLPCSDCVVGRTVFHTNLPTGLRRRRGG